MLLYLAYSVKMPGKRPKQKRTATFHVTEPSLLNFDTQDHDLVSERTASEEVGVLNTMRVAVSSRRGFCDGSRRVLFLKTHVTERPPQPRLSKRKSTIQEAKAAAPKQYAITKKRRRRVSGNSMSHIAVHESRP